MGINKMLRDSSVALILVALAGSAFTASAADLGGDEPKQLVAPAPAFSGWSFKFTTYGWLPWVSGDVAVKSRTLDVSVAPNEILEHLDWSTLPSWMSYAEARNGRMSLFNDIVYSKVTGSRDFARSSSPRIINASLGGNVEVDYEQAIVELGGAYEVWSGGMPGVPGSSAIDFLAGGRYWHQETDVSADFATTVDLGGLTISGGRAIAKSGSVDWIDPFFGARLRHQFAPGQELVVRGDIGGFGAGSELTWQVLATLNWQMCILNGIAIDAYVGYRALSVDYSQGSGSTRYEFNVLQQGPVIGFTSKF